MKCGRVSGYEIPCMRSQDVDRQSMKDCAWSGEMQQGGVWKIVFETIRCRQAEYERCMRWWNADRRSMKDAKSFILIINSPRFPYVKKRFLLPAPLSSITLWPSGPYVCLSVCLYVSLSVGRKICLSVSKIVCCPMVGGNVGCVRLAVGRVCFNKPLSAFL
jgi:hypothetical protein